MPQWRSVIAPRSRRGDAGPAEATAAQAPPDIACGIALDAFPSDLPRQTRRKGLEMKSLLSLLRDEAGPTTVEYAVMLALILAMIIAAVSAVGSGTGGMWGGTKSQLDQAGFGN